MIYLTFAQKIYYLIFFHKILIEIMNFRSKNFIDLDKFALKQAGQMALIGQLWNKRGRITLIGWLFDPVLGTRQK